MKSLLRAILGVCFLLHFFYPMQAQSILRLSGKVTANDGQPLPGATVLLRKLNPDSSFVGFAFTEADGHYQLSANTDTTHLLLTAQLLGYTPQHLHLSLNPSTNSYQLHFMLQQQALSINEVIVKAKVIPIRAKGDTVVYNANSFTDGSERSVEDLLKKLPGIKVSEDGTITAKGKPIEKVLIEGEDLFSRNYKLISRSMAANLIDKIEAIDNFSDNPLLHGVEKSGKTVLNLTIKEERKKIVFGNVDVQAGTAQRYEVKSSLFSLVQRLKMATILQANTTGNDPIPDTEYHLTADDIKQSGSPENNRYSPLLLHQTTENPPLQPHRYTFNKAQLGAVSISYRLADRLKVKAYSYLSANQRWYSQLTDNTYVFDTVRFMVRDSTELRITPQIWNTHIQLTYNQPNQYSLQLTTNQKKSLSNTHLYTNSQNIIFPEIVQLTGHEQFQVLNHNLNFVRRLSGNNVLVADAGYQTASLPQSIQVQTRRYADYLQLAPSFTQFNQKADLNVRQYRAIVRWKGSYQGSFYALGIGFSGQKQEGLTQATANAPGEQLFMDARFNNESNYNIGRTFFEGSYSIRLKSFILSLSNVLEYNRLAFNNKTHQQHLSKNRLLWNPTAAIGLDLGTQRRIMVVYARTQTPPTLQQLQTGYTLADYRTLSRGTPLLHIVNSNALVVNYSDFSFSNLYTALGNITVSHDKNPYIYQSNITNSLSLFTLTPYHSSLDRYSVTTEINRFFKGLDVNLQLDGNFSVADIVSSPQGNLTSSRLIRTELGFAGVTAFNRVFNIEAGSRFTHLQLMSTTADQSVDNLSKNLFIKPRIVLKIGPTKTTRLRLTQEWVRWQNNSTASNLLFLDGTFQWNPHQKQYSFELIGNNLLNTKNFIYTQFGGNYLITQKQFMLQPRYITVRAEWRF